MGKLNPLEEGAGSTLWFLMTNCVALYVFSVQPYLSAKLGHHTVTHKHAVYIQDGVVMVNLNKTTQIRRHKTTQHKAKGHKLTVQNL